MKNGEETFCLGLEPTWQIGHSPKKECCSAVQIFFLGASVNTAVTDLLGEFGQIPAKFAQGLIFSLC